jgi:UDP-2,3-diacylglucosamine hydrolase
MSGLAHFVSDLHLGADYRHAKPDREAHFRRFLETRAAEGTHLFILGDLFEFWMEYEDYIPKHHFGTLAALERLVAKGVEVHYVSGNHDFNLGRFFSDTLGIKVYHRPVPVELQGRKLLLLHGDGLAKSDWKYRIAKGVTLHPFTTACFKLIHPDWGMSLARSLSRLSRDQHGNRSRMLPLYEAAGRRLLKNGYDVVMHGHTHAGFVRQVPEGTYVNTGEWLGRMEYVRMEGGSLTLETYSP